MGISWWGLNSDYKIQEYVLCEGRHITPTTDCIFEAEDIDFSAPNLYASLEELAEKKYINDLPVVIYVTGYTPALIAALNAARKRCLQVTLMHYNPATKTYEPQEVYAPPPCIIHKPYVIYKPLK